jgi:hypothetical protein
MAEPDGSGISARLLRLPGQLLLALINATAILVIVAAVVALVAIARINRFVENVAATMTEAVLSKVDLPQKDVLANIRNLTTEVRTLGDTLREIKAGEHPVLQSELAQLKEALTVLNVSVDRLGSARSILTDEAIGQLGRTVTDALTKLRDCSPSARQMAPDRTLGNKMVKAREPHPTSMAEASDATRSSPARRRSSRPHSSRRRPRQRSRSAGLFPDRAAPGRAC